MTCPNCKKHYEGFALFCAVCGSKLVSDEEFAATPAAEPAQEQPQPEAFAATNFDTQKQESVNEAPLFNQQQYSAPQFEQPQYAQPQFEQPQYAQPQFEQPQYAPYSADAAKPVFGVSGQPAKPAKKMRKKRLLGIVSGVLALVLVFVGVGIFFSMQTPAFSVYVSDGKLMFTDYKNELKLGDTGEIGSITFDADASRVFYIKDSNLYVRETKKNGDTEKLDSDVAKYELNEKGDAIVYAKPADNGEYDIYYHNLKKKTKVGKSNSSYYIWISKDGKRVLFRDTENKYYIWKNGYKEKVASDEIKVLYFVEENFKYFVYTNGEEELYIKKDGKRPEKIASYEAEPLVFSDDCIYYSTDTESDDYTVKLYFYDGKSSTSLSTNVNGHLVGLAYDSGSLLYTATINDTESLYLASKGEVTKIDLDLSEWAVRGVYDICAGDSIYFKAMKISSNTATTTSSSLSHTLYRVTPKGELEKVDEDLTYDPSINYYVSYEPVLPNDAIFYFKDVKRKDDGTLIGDLYRSGKKLDEDVRVNSLSDAMMPDSNYIAYITEDDTLKLVKGNGSPKTIDSDVTDFRFAENDDLLYIRNDDLFRSTGGKGKKIATEVSAIRTYITSKCKWSWLKYEWLDL